MAILMSWISKIVATAMPNIEKAASMIKISQSDQSSGLASLEAIKANLEKKQAGWEVALSIALLVTAVAAFMVFIFDWRVRKSSSSIQRVQEEIIRAKDSELQISLREKDVKIAEAGDRASAAETKAEGFRLEIAKANAQTAALEVAALKLRGQMLQQGPRGNLITGENRTKLIEALKPFAGQKVDVRHSASVFMVNSKIVSATPIGDDVVGLANVLVSVLREAGWNVPSQSLPSGFSGYGLYVRTSRTASPETTKAAGALVTAIKELSIDVAGPLEVADKDLQRVGIETVFPALDENTIVLT